jgi:radical SAM protein with 4Fe4S-binding SPASM domain
MFTYAACPAGPSSRVASTKPYPPPVVKLVPFDTALPARLNPPDPVSQCDCACYAVEGEGLPTLAAPVSFYLELTPFCPNLCPGCGNVFPRDPEPAPAEPLSADQWAQVLDKIRPYVHRLKLTGGEPTVHPEFEAIVAHTTSLDLAFTLFTNGCWPEPGRLIRLLAGTPRFEGLLVSVHGPDPASHEAFTRTSGSFVETAANVRKATRAGLPLSLSCVITHHNWQRIDEMRTLARRLGANSIVFNRHIGPAIAGLTASPDELRAALHRIRALRDGGAPLKFGNSLPLCFAATGQAACLAGRAFLTVDPWGRVRPCNHAPTICGDLLQQSVEQVWASPALDQWRNWQPAACGPCTAFSHCHGGCQAQALSLGLEADPLMDRKCLPVSNAAPAEWALFEQARPVARFSRQPQPFGSLLMLGNRLFPVGREMQDALKMLDGQNTLRQIETAYGAPALSLVASLYQQGMVELQS